MRLRLIWKKIQKYVRIPILVIHIRVVLLLLRPWFQGEAQIIYLYLLLGLYGVCWIHANSLGYIPILFCIILDSVTGSFCRKSVRQNYVKCNKESFLAAGSKRYFSLSPLPSFANPPTANDWFLIPSTNTKALPNNLVTDF